MTALSLILHHTTHPSSHTRDTESAVLTALGIDVDEGRYVSYGDAAVLALTLWAVASDLADRLAVRALVSEIPPQQWREALEEVQALTETQASITIEQARRVVVARHMRPIG